MLLMKRRVGERKPGQEVRSVAESDNSNEGSQAGPSQGTMTYHDGNSGRSERTEISHGEQDVGPKRRSVDVFMIRPSVYR